MVSLSTPVVNVDCLGVSVKTLEVRGNLVVFGRGGSKSNDHGRKYWHYNSAEIKVSRFHILEHFISGHDFIHLAADFFKLLHDPQTMIREIMVLWIMETTWVVPQTVDMTSVDSDPDIVN
ncbi:hypothetical protein N7508_007579 [Penicillium antarcticum]|uniref:uncharacterized protein n=1 Tax=Penicillium antarcticum TaxID=416450 RepID=UPI00238A753A|nr:uncharacterized protein N7508_007579 [Penicillium antarcticum]KAJ5297330.1 hypothetical protein N7508_007579 [Penicillium antarcticum]